MSFELNFNFFNRLFICFGVGSIKHNGDNWMSYAWRCVLNLIHLGHLYTVNTWILNYESNILEPMSIVMIMSMELKYFGQLISLMWRIFYENHLSTLLTKLEDIHEQLRILHIFEPLQKNSVWLFGIGVFLHFAAHLIRPIDVIISVRNLSSMNWVILLVTEVCHDFVFYEYLLLILCVRWTVRMINEGIRGRRAPLVELRNVHLGILECLQDINRTVFGLPVLISLIGGHVAEMLYVTYLHILFGGVFMHYKKNRTVAIINVTMKFMDTLLLYGICQATEKEINRTSLILNERSLIETDQRVQRQIKFFTLRRMHEKFDFELCGFYKVNFRQLLILLTKTVTFLVIQIQFKVRIIGKKLS